MTKEILLIKSEPHDEVIQATSLIKAFDVLYGDYRLTWVTSEPYVPYLRFNKNINKIFTTEDIHSDLKGTSAKLNKYDVAINLDYTNEHAEYLDQVEAEKKLGFILKDGKISAANKKSEYYIKIRQNGYFRGKNTSHYFQIIFQICGIKWRGQGYAIHYKPQKKANKKSIGIVSNVNNHQSIVQKLKERNVNPKILNCSLNPITIMNDVWECETVLCNPDCYMHTSLSYRKNIIVPNLKNKSNFCFFGQENNVLKTENEDEIIEHVLRTIKHECTSMHGRSKDSNRVREDLPPSE